MAKTVIATLLLAIAISFSFILLPSSPKSFYHSLFISSSFSDNTSISNHLHTLTRRPHVAGTEANQEAANYVLSTLTSHNIKTHFASYQVLLSYPISRSLTLKLQNPGQQITFDLRQEIYNGDPYSDVANQVLPTFHAYAQSGTVIGPVVYVNYGRVEDYEELKEMGVHVSGCIALARYGKIFRGSIVQNAMNAGAIGAVLFTDRKDYGGGGDGDEKAFPEGKWMPPSGVQVGSVYNGSGDPTTPGWASTEGCERITEEQVENGGDVPRIPSLPISAADGEVIIKSIGGAVAKDEWQGSSDAPSYRIGPGPAVLNLSYYGNQTIATIQNVIGVIEGREEPDRFVILGNHRDAWTFGAVDPNSGTAALLEVARRLNKLQKMGWKPRRTIILCNWDAEEYGLIGSTEWVEENKAMLSSRAVAYLNVDVGVQGPGFQASATPQLDELLKQATKQVPDPDNSSQTVYELWLGSGNSPKFGRLGAGGSDYKAFVQHIGVPAGDMSFWEEEYPVYHSMYDDFIWMKSFGDPMFHRHVAVASVWGLLALRLADDEILPFNYLSYANELLINTKDLENLLTVKDTVSLAPMFKSIDKLRQAATIIESQKKEIEESKGWPLLFLSRNQMKTRELNDRLMMAERAFTDPEGLFGRPWYKHLLYASSRHDDYGSKSFPGVDDAIERAKSLNSAESWQSVQHEIWRVARVIKHASLVLNGILT